MSHNLVLRSHEDWFDWSLLMRHSISPRHLWDTYISKRGTETPDFPPPILDKPVLDDFRTAEQIQHNLHITLCTIGFVAPDQLRAYQVAKHEYDLMDIERQDATSALEDLHSLMLRSVKTSSIKFLHEHRFPATLYRALKADYYPTNEVWIDKIRQSYRDHCENGATNGYTVDEWLTKWFELNKYVVALDMPEAQEIKHDVRRAQTGLDPCWATVLLTDPYKKRQFPEILNETRHHYLVEGITQFPVANSFATLHGRPTVRDAKVLPSCNESPKYVCSGYHRYIQCWHLNSQAAKIPRHFLLADHIQVRITEALKNPRVRQGVHKAIPAYSMVTNVDRSHARPSFEDAFPFANMALSHSFQAQSSMSSLKDSWVIDTGSEWHICNDKNRFHSLYSYDGPDVLTGDSRTACKESGKAYVRVVIPDTIINRVFRVVKYIPGFHTNIIDAALLENETIFLNTRIPQLEDGRGICVARLARYGGMYLLENNTVDSYSMNSKTPSIPSGSSAFWHRQLAHANYEAIKYLAQTTKNISFDNKRGVDLGGQCDVCELAKAQRQVSRVSPQRSTTPFSIFHIDLIVISHPAFNGHKYVYDAVCDACRYHFVHTGSSRTILDVATR